MCFLIEAIPLAIRSGFPTTHPDATPVVDFHLQNKTNSVGKEKKDTGLDV